MGIFRDGVSGIGISATEDMLKKLEPKAGWDDQPWELEEICKSHKVNCRRACFYGDGNRFYFCVRGRNLSEINENTDDFFKFCVDILGIEATPKDLKLISDIFET